MSVSDELKIDAADDLLTTEIHPETLFPPWHYGWDIFRLFFSIGGILGFTYVLSQQFVALDARIAIGILVLAVSALCAFFAWAGAHEVVRHYTTISIEGDELIIIRKARVPIKGSWSDVLLRPRGSRKENLGFKELNVRVPLPESRYFLGLSYLDRQFYQFRRRWCLLVSWPPYDNFERVAVAFSEREIEHWLNRLKQSPAVRTRDHSYWEREIIAAGSLGGALGASALVVVMVMVTLNLLGNPGLHLKISFFPAILATIFGGWCGLLASKILLGFEISNRSFKNYIGGSLLLCCVMVSRGLRLMLRNAQVPGIHWLPIFLGIVISCGVAGVYCIYLWGVKRETKSRLLADKVE